MNRSLSHLQAILIAILGYTVWVLNDSLIKLVSGLAIPPQEIICVFGTVSVIALATKAGYRHDFRSLRPHNWRGQIILALLALASFFTCVVALAHLPFTIFYIVIFSTPMMVAILGAVVLKEYLARGKIIAVVAGFAGVIIALNPFDKGGNLQGDAIGYAAGVGNVLCFAGIMILQRRFSRTETSDSLAFMQSLFQALGSGLWLIFSHVPLSPLLFLVLCGGGLLSIMGTVCNIVATKHTTAATVAQFHYTQIISGALLGFLIWHEVPTLPLIAGSLVIIASGLYIANHMRRAKIDPTVKPP